MTATLEAVLDQTQAVLLDFDGPVCGLFSQRPNHVVAGELGTFLQARGITLPSRFEDNRDPLKLLQWVGTDHPRLVGQLDDILIREETRAAKIADPTAGAHEAIAGFARAQLPVAIVSNNSAAAISAYLDVHRLTSMVQTVAGRRHGHPESMKPDPDSLLRALNKLGEPANTCCFIGDSHTDVEAAQAAGVASIGYAKTERHRAALANAGADVIVDDMRVFVSALGAA